MKSTSLGIDAFQKKLASGAYRKKRLGLLCHPSSVTNNLSHLVDIAEKKSIVSAFFGPQHGIHGETQDNMIEWQDHRDNKGRPIYSLYGERRKPAPTSLQDIDEVVIDLFDVGARYYTFIYTMAYMLEACGRLKIPVSICDRPNPLGGHFIEGPILNLNFKSFVGLYETPVCHAMTVGELAGFFRERMQEKPDLHIYKMRGWNRKMWWPETHLRWTLPSPNMPSFETSVLYPGMCLLEATTLSEGRGTTRPFELIGAPFFDWNDIEKEYLSQAKKLGLSPVLFHRQGFIPTFHKFKGELCKGALQIVPSPMTFKPLRHAVLLLWVFRKLYGDQWAWKEPPYEYEYEKWPIDILAGGTHLREAVDSGSSLKNLFAEWSKDESAFKKIRAPYLLY